MLHTSDVIPHAPFFQRLHFSVRHYTLCILVFVYIGQTKRNLNTRLKEHQRAIKQQKPENSALCEHVIETDHLIGWSNARILKVETNYFKRLTAESWFIHSHPKVLNRSDGESLPVIYRSLL